MYQNIFIQRQNKEKIVHIWDDQRGYYREAYRGYAYIKSPNGRYQTLYGDRVKKVNSFTKFQWPKLFEADVPADTRMLVDLYSDSDDVSTGHRDAFIDIEVEHEEKYPDIEKADLPINAISLYERTIDEYYVFILDKLGEVEAFEKDGVVLMPFNTEEQLLEAFLDKWHEINPSIVVFVIKVMYLMKIFFLIVDGLKVQF